MLIVAMVVAVAAAAVLTPLIPRMPGAARAVAERRPVRPGHRLGRSIERHGFGPAVQAHADRVMPDLVKLQAKRDRSRDAAQRAQARRARLTAPALANLQNPVPHVVVVVAASVAWLFFFWTSRALDTGILRTNGVANALAPVVGTIYVVMVTLLGVGMSELLWPSGAIPPVQSASRSTRYVWAAALGTVLVFFIAPIPKLASVRAETRFGQQVDVAAAKCHAMRADPTADPAARELACADADRKRTQLGRAREWDKLVSVAAPVGDAATSWAALRLLELVVAGAAALGERRAADQRDTDETAYQAANQAFIAEVSTSALGRATPDEIAAWRGSLADPGPPPPEAPAQPGPSEAGTAPPSAGDPTPDRTAEGQTPPRRGRRDPSQSDERGSGRGFGTNPWGVL